MSRFDIAFEIMFSNRPLPRAVTLTNDLVDFIWDMYCFPLEAQELKEALCPD